MEDWQGLLAITAMRSLLPDGAAWSRRFPRRGPYLSGGCQCFLSDLLDAVIISRPRDPPSESPRNIFRLGAAFEHVRDRTLAERQALKAVSAGWSEAPKICPRNCASAIKTNDDETANCVRCVQSMFMVIFIPFLLCVRERSWLA